MQCFEGAWENRQLKRTTFTVNQNIQIFIVFKWNSSELALLLKTYLQIIYIFLQGFDIMCFNLGGLIDPPEPS